MAAKSDAQHPEDSRPRLTSSPLARPNTGRGTPRPLASADAISRVNSSLALILAPSDPLVTTSRNPERGVDRGEMSILPLSFDYLRHPPTRSAHALHHVRLR
jgi:hypothetical protein